MRTTYRSAALSLATVAALLISSGCNTQPDHPNQLNSFDGTTYDSLTLAHGALTSLRAAVAETYPQYKSQFNEAVASYATTYNAYALYRAEATSSTQAQISVALQNLTVSIVVLEDIFETDMHVSTETMYAIRSKAARIRASAGSNISVADVLTALEIAAAIAETVPAAAPYSALAATVIAATDAALSAETAEAGQLIDLSTIEPVPQIQ